ncbi:TPA: HNH endonuclease family protein [Streptococcus suis]
MTPIEVIVSKTTANASDRKNFERNWQEIVQRTDSAMLDLNSLITHYIFVKLSEQNGADRRNPGIRVFFSKNKYLLNDDVLFTTELDKIIDNYESVADSIVGQLLSRLNGNLRPFISSYLFFRSDSRYLDYLLRLGILIELSKLSYSHRLFKGFLEEINLMYSQVDLISTTELIDKVKNHIQTNFEYDEVKQILSESGVSNSLLYINEFLFAIETGAQFNLEGNIDIEHIMPQSGRNRENMMLDAGFDNQEEFREYAEKIGNKILLEADINRGIGDAWFRIKRENSITSGHGYIGSKFPIAKSLVNYPKGVWTKTEIELATERAARRIANFVFER